MATVFRDINNKQNQALVTDSSVTKWKLNKMGKTSQIDPNCLQPSETAAPEPGVQAAAGEWASGLLQASAFVSTSASCLLTC